MTRHVNWARRLSRMIEAARPLGHEWGPHDCASFALRRCYWAVTGRFPPVDYFHKTYDDEAGASEVMAEMGCSDVEEMAETFLERHAAPALIRRGDIGVAMDHGRKVLVVCNGELFAPGIRCLHIVPRSALIAAFKVD